MILVWLIVIPLLAGPAAWLSERRGRAWPRWIAGAALGLDLLIAAVAWAGTRHDAATPAGRWLAEWTAAWIPRWGITVHLAMDGISVVLVVLTGFLGLMALVASWTEIRERVGFFHFNLLWVIAGTVGVFLAVDLFLFFVFWEVMLIPMYFLINIWGHEHKTYAALKFFLFTQAGSLLMLIAILGLVFVHARQTGTLTFDYAALLGTPVSPETSKWLMLGFFAAFAVKLPAFPVHSWLPDAHTEAPTGGSVLLAGLLLKTGAYGLLRFAIPLFPEASDAFAPVAIALAVIGILYGAVLAFAQHDLKRLVAYSSISHLGFVLLGLYAWNRLALQGAVMQMVAHGVSTGALFMLVGALQQRLHTRDMRRMGGLWAAVPRLAAIALFFAIASLGLPGLANFVGEFLVLMGSYQVTVLGTALAMVGIVAATIYALALVQRTFHGPIRTPGPIPDLPAPATAAFAVMIAVQVWLGVYPQPVLSTVEPALDRLQASTASARMVQR
ncbi:NADH-quinone oxidoreductase subunit M [Candidatus Nitrospira bockiana]